MMKPVRTIRLVVKLPADARVFVLDDDHLRLSWFRSRLNGRGTYASTAADAIEILRRETFDAYFLDHDLVLTDADGGTGQEVAAYLGESTFGENVVIHSLNDRGTRAMQAWLPLAVRLRFGDFDLEVDYEDS